MRTRLAALAGAGALLVLTGCGSDLGPDLHPGAAAVVGDESISIESVDDLSSELCGFYSQVAGTSGSVALVRSQVLSTKLSGLKAELYAEEFDLDPRKHVRVQKKAFEEDLGKSQMSAAQKDVVREFVEPGMYAEGVYIAAGMAEAPANDRPSVPTARENGAKAVAEWIEGLDVSTDPRFAEMGEDGLILDPSALSVSLDNPKGEPLAPASMPAHVGELPESQKCS